MYHECDEGGPPNGRCLTVWRPRRPPASPQPPQASSRKVIGKEEWERKLAEVDLRKEDLNSLVMNFLVTEVLCPPHLGPRAYWILARLPLPPHLGPPAYWRLARLPPTAYQALAPSLELHTSRGAVEMPTAWGVWPGRMLQCA